MYSSSKFATRRAHCVKADQRGVTVIEVLIALLVLAFGMLGAAGLLVRAQQGEFESYQRKHALMIVDNFAARMQANRPVADDCYAITTNVAAGTPFLGTGTTLTQPFTCTAGSAAQQNTAVADLTALQDALLGSGETQGGGNVGALSSARACVSKTGNDTIGWTFTVSVVWQGISETAPPPATATCGAGLYGSESLRRAISMTFYVPNLVIV